jgi:sugar/nucleoside kinase (ribokinase family)
VKTGGSAGIVVKSLGCLGCSPVFLSKYGSDKEAQFFKSTLQEYGVTLLGKNVEGETGRVLCCISPDGQRSFFFCMESIGDPDVEDVIDSLFQNVKILHIEGYFLRNKPLLEKLLKVALNNRVCVSFDLGTFVLVKENREYLKHKVLPYIHILIGNHDEMKALFNTDHEIDHSLKELACTSVVLKGEEGCLLYCDGVMKRYSTRKVIPLDTTGAGDLFTSGFLFGILKNWPIEKCVQLANLLGGEVVQHIGGEIPQNRWNEIKKEFSL